MKTYHEAPLYYVDDVDTLTDGFYCLVHLCEEYPEYLDKTIEMVQKSRNVILDNSIFELGEAFDAIKFAEWINIIKPTEYIIPDALEDMHKTIYNVETWDYSLPGKSIGVVQGKTYEELTECYKRIAPFVDKIAISFDYSWYLEITDKSYDKLDGWMYGRQHLLNRWVNEGIIDHSKPHHLLGNSKAREGTLYNNNPRFSFIESVDTSNPVMVGIEGTRYGVSGVDFKPETKLFTLIDWIPEQDQQDTIRENILYNVKKFKEMWG